ncbi:hypothetical protein DFQ01_12048 [Paenibacillus cellulosilyticus]|uniref:Uncharacterized protein n=1 Tax=Paenibacillus cellulosilyticus TaxID=375489 RepID=A0A2V2YY29_9BACL|nr:hypothetical protein DFQ01_12048 [Paenibacillus cellulosilyticus]
MCRALANSRLKKWSISCSATHRNVILHNQHLGTVGGTEKSQGGIRDRADRERWEEARHGYIQTVIRVSSRE